MTFFEWLDRFFYKGDVRHLTRRTIQDMNVLIKEEDRIE